MSCISPSETEMEALKRKMGKVEMNENITELLRGGWVIKSSIGIQILLLFKKNLEIFNDNREHTSRNAT